MKNSVVVLTSNMSGRIVAKDAFFSFGGNEVKFLQSVKRSQLLTAVWAKSTPSESDVINAPTTLPIELKPKATVNFEVASENPTSKGVGLLVRQNLVYGKSVVNFYRKGIGNIWSNRSELSRLRKAKFKLSNILDRKGKETDINIPSFRKLTQEMAQTLYQSSIENRAYRQSTTGDVIKADKQQVDVDTGLFNLTRSQYQLLRRTPADLAKLPVFAIVFAMFFEMTPFVCYAFPEITPLTCTLPLLLPRVWKPKNTQKVLEWKKNAGNLEDLALKNAYNLPIDQVRMLARALRLTPNYIPIALFPESALRDRLQHHYNYLKVDNYFLSGLNEESRQNVWDLSHQELQNACLERLLIEDIRDDAQQFDNIKDEASRKVQLERYFNELRLKLVRFIVDFEQYNVGYLGTTLILDETPNTKDVVQWRSNVP